MKRLPISCTLIPAVVSDSSAASPTSAAFRSHRRTVLTSSLALLGLNFGALAAIAQDPTPIPNWTTGGPGTTAGQYAPAPQAGQDTQQPYGQPQDDQQPPQYQQPPDYGQQQAYAPPDGTFAPYQPVTPAPAVTPDRLEQMVAPIALYPDNLVSMILAASTYPAEVTAADQWLHMQGAASAEQIAAGANAQSGWDPSVKALTAFPQVLDMLAQNLQWTTDLGNAYYNQPQDVMQTIQVMRSRAETAGNLQTTPQQEVIVDQGNIEIAPPTPQVVYVPTYDPWAVYGQPVPVYPGFNWVGATVGAVASAFISWGPGIALDAFAVTPFGWLGWGLDWFAHAIFFHDDFWCTHSHEMHDWGFAHGGYRYWGARGEMARFREGGWGGRGGWGDRGWAGRGGYGGRAGYGQRGGFGGRGGYDAHVFRSGLDRGRFSNARPVLHGGPNHAGNQGGYGHGFGGNGNSWSGGNRYQGSGNGNQHGGDQHGGNGYGQNGRGVGFGYGSNNGGAFGHGNGFGQNGNSYQHGGNNYGQNGRGIGYGYGSNNGTAYGHGGSGNTFGQNGGPYGRGNNGYGANGYGNSGEQRGYARTPQPTGRPLKYGGQQQSYGRAPQAVGAPQQYAGGARQFAQQGYRGTQQAYGGSYGRQSAPGLYNHPLQNYGMRPGFGGSSGYAQPRAPSYGGGSRPSTYGGSSPYGGSYNYGRSNIARNPSSGGIHIFGGGGGSHSSGGYNYGGGSFKAPRAPSFSSHSFGGGGRSWGGGGGGFKAPRMSGGGHFGGGGGGHFGGGGGGHFGGGGGHSGGGGHGGRHH